jgi:hypothetical protein
MRLANDRDQDIIRSAIPNSSISTTSFLSSIGNGEAIAFGEAIAVPMRMRFSRVEEHLLPKANGSVARTSEDTPDTVDLRTVVSRMRSIAGPDISAFQQSYAALSDTADDMDEDFNNDRVEQPAPTPQPTRIAAPPIEPYRPDMLPRPPVPAVDGTPRTSIDSRLAELRRDYRGEDNSGNQPHPARDVAPPRRETGLSLRDSILKKPLSSLYNKD